MARPNDKKEIRKFYDAVSPHFQAQWGDHLHHGYWIRGDEGKEKAQVQLIEHLAAAAGIQRGSAILDVGCGMGGSAIYLAKKYDAKVTGITISPVQVEMANQAAANASSGAKFLLMDAEAMKFDEPFDVIWSVESVSHYQNKAAFFASAAPLLGAGGKLAVIDWFKRDGLDEAKYKKFIRPIETGMLAELQTMSDYEKATRANGLEITRTEVMNENCAKSWDIGLEILKDKALWRTAARNGFLFVRFLKAFRAMRAGFRSGTFVYGLIVATKP